AAGCSKTVVAPPHRAVAYAHGIGFHPHPDDERVILLFGSVRAADSGVTFPSGKDGQPFFMAGPHDSQSCCRQVLAILDKPCGPGLDESLLPLVPPGGPDLKPGRIRILGPDERIGDEGEGADVDADEDEEAP